MRSGQLIFWFLLVCSVDACAQPLVSLADILNNQEQYDGRAIQTYGIASFQFEKTHLRTKDGSVRLSLYDPPYTEESIKKDEERITQWSVHEGQCVLVNGVFRKGGKYGAGYYDGRPAEIEKILSIEGAEAKNCSH